MNGTERSTAPVVGKHKSTRSASSGRIGPGAHRQPVRRRGHVGALALVVFAATAGATGAALDQGTAKPARQDTKTAVAAPTAAARPSAQVPDVPTPDISVDEPTRPVQQPAPKRQKPTPVTVPETGSGELLVAAGSTSVVGTGTVTSYTVEVEQGLPLQLRVIAATVDEVLADPRGWTADGGHGLQRTDGASDVRVVITTPETTDDLCAPLDTGGRLSCRMGDLVVLNAWRWVNGAPAFGDDLVNYRRYLINHEFGHALGNPHEDCPEEGALAPVMMQQTKGVGDCEPNPWPYPSS